MNLGMNLWALLLISVTIPPIIGHGGVNFFFGKLKGGGKGGEEDLGHRLEGYRSWKTSRDTSGAWPNLHLRGGSSYAEETPFHPKRRMPARDTKPGPHGTKRARSLDSGDNIIGVPRETGGDSNIPLFEREDGCEAPTIFSSIYNQEMSQLLEFLCQPEAANITAIVDEECRTPLHVAALLGNTNAVDSLLAVGAAVDTRDDKGRTALHFAAGAGHDAVIQMLADAGADIAAVDEHGGTALHHAAAAGQRLSFRVLAELGVSLMAVDREGRTAFEVGRDHGFELVPQRKEVDVNEVHKLLTSELLGEREAGGDLSAGVENASGNIENASGNQRQGSQGDAEDRGGWSEFQSGEDDLEGAQIDESSEMSVWGNFVEDEGIPSDHRSQLSNHESTEQVRVVPHDESGVASARDSASVEIVVGNMTMHQASMSGDHTSITLLAQNDPSLIHSPDCNGRTPLLVACAAGQDKAVAALLKLGADPMSRDLRNRTALHMAAAHHRFWLVELLVQAGTSVDARDMGNRTALMLAAWRGGATMVKKLLEAGAAHGAVDVHGCAALHMTCWRGFEKAALPLLEAGADVDLADEFGGTAIHKACLNGHAGVVSKLIERGASLDIADDNGCTGLHFASSNGFVDVIKRLVAGGADVSCRDSGGRSALHWAAHHGRSNCIEALAAAGADVNARDLLNSTALHIASEFGHTETVDMLVTGLGADCNALDSLKCNPLHFAARNGHGYLVDLLAAAGTKLDVLDAGGWSAAHWAWCNNHSVPHPPAQSTFASLTLNEARINLPQLQQLVVDSLRSKGCSFENEPVNPKEVMNFDELRDYALKSIGVRRRRPEMYGHTHVGGQPLWSHGAGGAAESAGPDAFGSVQPQPPQRVDGLTPFGSDLPSQPVSWTRVL